MDFTKKRKADENGTVAGALTADEARKILQPLTQDQLIGILQDAVVSHSDVLDAVRTIANRETSHRKLFVRGLSADTTSESLRAVFAAFGDLDEAIVIADKNTGKSKGYGFVTFCNADAALLALRQPSKKIDSRIAVTQFAASGQAGAGESGDVAARKIYVGNVPFDVSSEKLLSHFMVYGDIKEGPLGFEKSAGKSRGFAFFIYKTEEGARAALVDPMKTIDGHQIACKLAVDNKKPRVMIQAPAAEAAADQYSHAPPVNMYQGYHAPPVIPGGSYGVPAMANQAPASFSGGYSTNYAGPYGGEFGGRLPPSNAGYQEGLQYSAGSAGVPPMQQLPPVARTPPGGKYQGLPHYYGGGIDY